jgi:two-component system OmpR family response regulator
MAASKKTDLTYMRLLLLEDEWCSTEVVSEGLEQAGFVADALNTVQAAEYALQTIHYDALILDLALPDGEDLACCADFGSATASCQC